MTPMMRMVLAALLFAAATVTAASTANIEKSTQQSTSDQMLSAAANAIRATRSVTDLSGHDEFDVYGGHQGHDLPAVYISNGATVITRCTVPHTAALTYDDGPYKFTNELLDILRGKGVKATFFINGDNKGDLSEYEEVVKRAYREGHQIASHTWSHDDLSKLSSKQVRMEMTKCKFFSGLCTCVRVFGASRGG